MRRYLSLISRSFAFARRHKWSLPLGVLSALFFVELASEVQEGELHAFDEAVAEFVVQGRGRLDGVMVFLTRLGGGRTMTALGVLVAALLLMRRQLREVVFLAICGVGAGLLNGLLKLAFGRTRPGADSLYLITEPSSHSFPSGHAMGSTGLLLSLLVILHASPVRRSVKLLATGLIAVTLLGICTSRIYLGVHFPSDVIGGMLGGAAWISAVTGWFYPRLLPGEATEIEPPRLEGDPRPERRSEPRG